MVDVMHGVVAPVVLHTNETGERWVWCGRCARLHRSSLLEFSVAGGCVETVCPVCLDLIEWGGLENADVIERLFESVSYFADEMEFRPWERFVRESVPTMSQLREEWAEFAAWRWLNPRPAWGGNQVTPPPQTTK